MKNTRTVVIVGIVLLLAIAAGFVLLSNNKDSDTTPNSSSSTSSTSSEDKTTPTSDTNNAVAADSVTIKDYAFAPASVTVKVGTTVTWTNQDSVQHSVASDNGNMPDGPLLSKGETYKYTFTKAGTYTYHCSLHPYMHGTVVVTE